MPRAMVSNVCPVCRGTKEILLGKRLAFHKFELESIERKEGFTTSVDEGQTHYVVQRTSGTAYDRHHVQEFIDRECLGEKHAKARNRLRKIGEIGPCPACKGRGKLYDHELVEHTLKEMVNPETREWEQ